MFAVSSEWRMEVPKKKALAGDRFQTIEGANQLQ
jgi:hypothetical protein